MHTAARAPSGRYTDPIDLTDIKGGCLKRGSHEKIHRGGLKRAVEQIGDLLPAGGNLSEHPASALRRPDEAHGGVRLFLMAYSPKRKLPKKLLNLS